MSSFNIELEMSTYLCSRCGRPYSVQTNMSNRSCCPYCRYERLRLLESLRDSLELSVRSYKGVVTRLQGHIAKLNKEHK